MNNHKTHIAKVLASKPRGKKGRIKSHKFVILFLILTLTSFFLFTSNFKYAYGQPSDLDYNFVQDTFVSINNPVFNESYNVRNTTRYTGFYNATFSFTDEIDGVKPENFSRTWEYNDIYYRVNASIGGHDKVFEIVDGNSTQQAVFYQDMPQNHTSEIIDLWVRVDTITSPTALTFTILNNETGTGTTIWRIKDIGGNKIQVLNGAAWQDLIDPIYIDTWYHLSIEFDCTTDKFNISVNSIKYGEYSFNTVQDEIDTIYGATGASYVGSLYFDAIGYIWEDNYQQFDNLFPYLNISQTDFEVDKDEFLTKSLDNFYDTGQSYTEVNNWTYYGTYDHILSLSSSWFYGYFDKPHFDLCTLLFAAIPSSLTGIEKNFNDNSSHYLNLTFAFNIQTSLITDGGFNFTARSNQNNDIISLFIDEDNILYYLDETYTPVSVLQITLNKSYKVNMFVDYGLNNCNLRIDNGTLFEFIFPLMNMGQIGLEHVLFEVKNDGGTYKEFAFYLDYIGIYSAGISKANDYGYHVLALAKNKDFHTQKYFLMTINATGYFGIIASETNGIEFNLERQQVLFDMYQHNYTQIFKNFYQTQSTAEFLENATVSLAIIGNLTYTTENFDIAYLNVEGFSMIEGTNEYLMDFTWNNNVSIDESYFYADSSNRLCWTIRSNGSKHESIQASFNIPTIAGDNRSINFNSYHNSSLPAFLILDNTDSSLDLFILDPFFRSYSQILDQSKFITQFRLNITDTDITENYTTKGYISAITFRYLPDIDITITTLNLISILVPLLVLIIPTLSIGGYYGKKTYLWVFMFMSLFCVITDLIPVWLFFIICFCFSLFLFVQRRRREFE